MQKAELVKLLDDILNGLLTWIQTQPNDTFATQKTVGKWSNGEHLEHLRKSTRAVNKTMKMPKLLLRYKFGTNNRNERSYQETVKKYKTKVTQPGIKAPPAFSPVDITNEDRERVMAWFQEEKEQMQSLVSKLSEKQLSKYVIPHPLIGKLTFREFVYFTALHADHHLDLMKKYNSFP